MIIRSLFAVLALASAALASPQTLSRGEVDQRLAALDDEAAAAVQRGDWRAALSVFERSAELDPLRPYTLYNIACAHAQLGDTEAAVEWLLDALSVGFVDLHHLARDAHLLPLRDDARYRTVISNWRPLLDARADAIESAMLSRFERAQSFREDELRLLFVAQRNEASVRRAIEDSTRLLRWSMAELFTSLEMDTADSTRPDPWVLVLLPTPEEFVRLSQRPDIGGFYDHDQRRLISRDLGPSLRHELLHVMHWRDLARRGQRHPEWVMEGLAALVEDVRWSAAGEPQPIPSWRTNIARRLERGGRLLSIEELATMPRRQFVGVRPNAHYAQARAWMLFLLERNRLGAWYRAYVEGFDEDPSGVGAMARALDMTVAETDRAFRAWLRDLPEVPERLEAGMAGLGAEIGAGVGDGPVIDAIRPVQGARRSGLRRRDVILSVDGQWVHTREDLALVLSELRPGDSVPVMVRRGTRELTLPVRLLAEPED